MAKKLYVGNLSYQVDGTELEQLFAQHGQVLSAQVINDRDTGLAYVAGIIGREVESTKELTPLEATKVIDSLKPTEQLPIGGDQ